MVSARSTQGCHATTRVAHATMDARDNLDDGDDPAVSCDAIDDALATQDALPSSVLAALEGVDVQDAIAEVRARAVIDAVRQR